MNIYKECPTFENESYELRLFRNEDCHDYLKVYGDKNALPYFNSDNCDGDNFFYNTEEKMRNALEFWQMSYEKGWFVRMSIIDKKKSEVIGSVELCTRVSGDDFNNMGILRVDVRSDYENEKELYSIFSLITPHNLKMECMCYCFSRLEIRIGLLDTLMQGLFLKMNQERYQSIPLMC